MTSYEAIFTRKSVRNFQMEEIEERLLNDIQAYEAELIPYDKNIKTKIEIIDCIFNPVKIKGTFTVKAPYYLAVYSEEADDKFLNAGYLMEQMVLFLHRKGLGTCYLGAGKVPDYKAEKDSCKFLFVVAFGYGKEDIKRRTEEAKRLELSKICVFKNELKNSTKMLLNAARMAPSSMNTQPWRFIVYDNRIHVFLQKSRLISKFISKWNHIDMGIVLCHFMLASDELWMDAEITRLDNITNKNIPNNKYIASVIWK